MTTFCTICVSKLCSLFCICDGLSVPLSVVNYNFSSLNLIIKYRALDGTLFWEKGMITSALFFIWRILVNSLNHIELLVFVFLTYSRQFHMSQSNGATFEVLKLTSTVDNIAFSDLSIVIPHFPGSLHYHTVDTKLCACPGSLKCSPLTYFKLSVDYL